MKTQKLAKEWLRYTYEHSTECKESICALRMSFYNFLSKNNVDLSEVKKVLEVVKA